MPQAPQNQKTAFTVALDSEVAWCISYEDEEGNLLFCFEPGEQKKRVYLNPRPSANGKMTSQDFCETARYKLALERTKAYLISCGYETLIDD